MIDGNIYDQYGDIIERYPALNINQIIQNAKKIGRRDSQMEILRLKLILSLAHIQNVRKTNNLFLYEKYMIGMKGRNNLHINFFLKKNPKVLLNQSFLMMIVSILDMIQLNTNIITMIIIMITIIKNGEKLLL